MIYKICALVLIAFAGLFLSTSAFAEISMSLDKSSYSIGQTIALSGNVEYQQGMPVIIQLRSSSDIVAIDQKFPSSSGEFSSTFNAEGSKWQESGTYTVLISYAGQTAQKTFQFSAISEEPAEPAQPNPEPAIPEKPQTTPPMPAQEKAKVEIRGFPDPTKSPQYYYERYKDNAEFKAWFGSMFAGRTIESVVGYKPTHVTGFPDQTNSPQYYMDRYKNENLFAAWFDQQFPEKTIYDVVGVTEETMAVVPDWIKQYAQLWSDGQIDDVVFIDRISNLIAQEIIEVDGQIIKQSNGDKTIPFWFKSTASWYGKNQITTEEFLSGIQYLIEKEIILV